MRVWVKKCASPRTDTQKERVESSKVGRSGTVKGRQTWTDPKSILVRQFGV